MARQQGIVPVSVECISADVDGGEFVVRNDAPGRILVGVQFAFDFEPCRGGCGSDQVDHHFVADQGLASPVLRDRREQTVLDLVPLAGSQAGSDTRPARSRPNWADLPDVEKAALADSIIAYCGRYELRDERIVHHVEQSLNPA